MPDKKLRKWLREHLAKGHEIATAPAKDRFLYTCSCGATWLEKRK